MLSLLPNKNVFGSLVGRSKELSLLLNKPTSCDEESEDDVDEFLLLIAGTNELFLSLGLVIESSFRSKLAEEPKRLSGLGIKLGLE